MHDAGEIEGRQYLVTEFVDGGTLKEWARSRTRTWRQIVELLIGVADGLAAAHEAGILHRDIKPANILVATNGYAKLADFGLAKLADAPRRRRPPDAVTIQSHTARRGRRHDRVHVAGAGVGQAARCAQRHLLVRRRALRVARRTPAVRAARRDLEVLHAVIHAQPPPLAGESAARAADDRREGAGEGSRRPLSVDARAGRGSYGG